MEGLSRFFSGALPLSLLLGSLVLSVFPSSSLALDPIPSRPIQDLNDGAKTLRLAFAKSLERVLVEHETLTGESLIVLTLARSPAAEKLDEYADRVFDSWKGLTQKPSSAIVLVFDVPAKRMVWRGGVGIDPVLVERGANRIQSEIVAPEMKKARADRAVLLSARRVLELVESPVFVNGKFDSDLREAGFVESFSAAEPPSESRKWWIWIALGTLLFAFVGYRILAVEVHYTSEGWRRVSVWESLQRSFRAKVRKSRNLVTGGGVSGSY
jgi:uncharacterized membrane protein YgcG